MREHRLVVVQACVAVFVVILDATVVAVALPHIGRDLGFDAAGLPWVVNAYTLVFAGFLMSGGRSCDVFGPRTTMLTGLALFGLASAACGLAASPAMLLVARAVQGLGGALLMPTSLASITRAIPQGPERTSALAVWSTVGAIGGTAGTLVGGVLTEALNWRWIFLINLPVVAVALAQTMRALPVEARTRRPLDLPGAALVTAGLTAVTYAVLDSTEHGWSSPLIWGGAAAGLALLTAFLLHEHRAREPLLPLPVFRSRSTSGACLAMFLTGLAFFAAPVLVSLYVQDQRGYSPLVAGIAFLPGSLALIVAARFVGRVTNRFGARRTAIGATCLTALGFAGLALGTATGAGYVLGIALPTVLYGLGFSGLVTPLTAIATRWVEPHRQGVVASLFNTVRQTSGAAGIAVLSAVQASAATVPSGGSAPAFTVAAGFAALSAVIATTALPRDHSTVRAAT
ncbi:MFS transporter [Pseudonocardia phyllosphaerae]|uniref:MFS transporter n=1 Tax=Pseudonocardia phyllosphaerae TaxID=3390502 RepID=UPI00397804D9